MAVAGVASGPAHEQPTKADEEAMARILADASRRAAKLPDEKQARAGLQVVPEVEAPPQPATPPAVPRDLATAAPRRTASERRADATATLGGRTAQAADAASVTDASGNDEPRQRNVVAATGRRCRDAAGRAAAD